MIVHHLEKLAQAGIQEVVINLGHLGSKISQFLGNGSTWGVSIEYSDEGPDPLETGGGMTKALPLLGENTFLLVNGDVWTDFDFSSIPRDLSEGDHAMLFLAKQPEWREKGDYNLINNRVCESNAPNLLYAGIALYHPSILDGAVVIHICHFPASGVPIYPLLPTVTNLLDSKEGFIFSKNQSLFNK